MFFFLRVRPFVALCTRKIRPGTRLSVYTKYNYARDPLRSLLSAYTGVTPPMVGDVH